MLLAGTLLLAGCYKEPVALTTWPPTEQPSLTGEPTPEPQSSSNPTADAGSPTPGAPSSAPGSLAVPPSGAQTSDCINGWTTPASGSVEYDEAIALLDSQMETDGPWQISEMRYFLGPDVSWAETRYDIVARWYVRAELAADASYRARWLIEKRADLVKGVAAVAPFESTGFQAPDWTGFAGDGRPTTYLGLPGQWTGAPYDFVTGGGYSGQPGLPDEVIGCLGAT